ncbi:MAG: hypothetical protein HYW34_02090 [Candidatus Brennerbacteria bacterium]|nr:hypothetical protein [Candidatus Brennerbacteria bacterium]
METNSQNTQQTAGSRWPLITLAIVLLGISLSGLIWLFGFSQSSPIGAGWWLFSFAAGLSMIVLPCTLPLAFVIVPLSLGKGPRKGLGIALAFGLGVAITLSLYGVFAAILGSVAIGSLGAPLEAVKNWLYVIAGIFAYLFALGELGLINFRMPSYTGAVPSFIQKQQDYLKALLLGLFLGNVGVGCPHPATPVILTRIAVSEDVFYGWMLFLVHAIGRIIPLILLVILALLGINALSWLTKNQKKVERMTGWAMVFVAGFILTLGLFTHDGWVYSGQHALFEIITAESFWTNIIAGRLGSGAPHAHSLPGGTGLFGLPYWLYSWTLVALWIIPLFWYWRREKKSLAEITNEADHAHRASYLKLMLFTFISLTAFLAVVFGYALPEWFVNHKSAETEEMMSEVPDIKAGLIFKQPIIANTEQTITIALKDEAGQPLTNLETGHSRLLHAVIISEDLKTFAHIHPEDFNVITLQNLAKAEFEIKYNFPKPMRYLMAVDFRHQGHDISKKFIISAAGDKEKILIEKNLELNKKINDYSITLETDPTQPLSNEETHLLYRIEKNYRPVKDLEFYLDAPAHLSIVSADLSTFIHTHGEIPKKQTASVNFNPYIFYPTPALAHGLEENETIAPEQKFGPDIAAHVIFPYPGLYKIFAEFNHQDKIILTDFMVEIGVGKNTGLIMPAHGH